MTENEKFWNDVEKARLSFVGIAKLIAQAEIAEEKAKHQAEITKECERNWNLSQKEKRARSVKDDSIMTSTHGECFQNGINGNCGVRCEVFLRGDCESPDFTDMEELIIEFGKEETLEICEYYDCLLIKEA